MTHLSSNDWNWHDPLMYVESRGQGFQFNYFYIYEFMGEAQDTAAAMKRGTRRSLWKRAAAGWDELELEPWVSLWSNHFGEESTPPLAWRSNGAEKFTAVEDFARYSVEDAQDAAAAGKEGDKEGCRCRGGGDKR